MDIKIIKLPSDKITDWDTFHAVFQEVFGFPEFYGRNMDAWNDCMTYLDDPDSSMSSVTVAKGGLVVIRVENALALKKRCPEQYDALVECAAFVNHRRVDVLHAKGIDHRLISDRVFARKVHLYGNVRRPHCPTEIAHHQRRVNQDCSSRSSTRRCQQLRTCTATIAGSNYEMVKHLVVAKLFMTGFEVTPEVAMKVAHLCRESNDLLYLVLQAGNQGGYFVAIKADDPNYRLVPIRAAQQGRLVLSTNSHLVAEELCVFRPLPAACTLSRSAEAYRVPLGNDLRREEQERGRCQSIHHHARVAARSL